VKKRSKAPLQAALSKQYLERSLFLHQSLKSARLMELVEEVQVLNESKFHWDRDGRNHSQRPELRGG